MLIATFGPTTAWVGKQITREGDAFVIEGHGPISAADIMEYDRQGHLLWVNAGTRAWVGSKAMTSAGSRAPTAKATPVASATLGASVAREATRGGAAQTESRRRAYLKRALLVAIAVLVIANAVLLLIILGVFHGP